MGRNGTEMGSDTARCGSTLLSIPEVGLPAVADDVLALCA
jgi:hypothetical protein